MEIVVRHEYGLGNQLFQYAAGRYFAKKYGASLRIAVDRPRKLSSHGQARPFLLPKFAAPLHYKQITTVERLCLSVQSGIKLATEPLRGIRRMQIIREPQPQPHTFNRDLVIPNGTRSAYLVGLWQCYPPAQMVEEELRSELSLREEPAGKNTELARKIQAARHPVSVHIRRGDYTLEYPESLLPQEYYLKAIAQMKQRLGDPTFFLFSDDSKFAHHFASTNPGCVVVDHNDADSAHEDLRLMSLCHHHIIANSTFSWWGAWLNPRKNKAVIAPSKWLKFDTHKIEIALPDWSLI